MVVLHNKLNEIPKCSNMVANSLPADPHDPRGWGQNSVFSEHGHVAYQIKGNHEFSNMVTKILPTQPHPGDAVNRS